MSIQFQNSTTLAQIPSAIKNKLALNQAFPNLFYNMLQLPLAVLISRPLRKNPVARLARNNVKVQMLNNLIGRPAVITQHVITIGPHGLDHRTGDLAKTGPHFRKNLTIALMDTSVVPLGNHQGMPITDRSDIEKRKHGLIFINRRYRNLSCDHLAEHAVIHDCRLVCPHGLAPLFFAFTLLRRISRATLRLRLFRRFHHFGGCRRGRFGLA